MCYILVSRRKSKHNMSVPVQSMVTEGISVISVRLHKLCWAISSGYCTILCYGKQTFFIAIKGQHLLKCLFLLHSLWYYVATAPIYEQSVILDHTDIFAIF